MVNVKNGAIDLGNGTIIDKDYTFEMFKKSFYYNNQDGIRIIDLEGVQLIEGKKYVVSLFFREGLIYMVSLINCDLEIQQKDEYLRKNINDKIIAEICIKNHELYSWGKIISEYDRRSGISSINIYYNTNP
jgi:hypothetical protein